MGLAPPVKVQKLQTTLHAKAKDSPGYRFYALYDKVYRLDVLTFAYRLCRANGGAPGVDGQSFEDIESYGLDRWLDEDTQVNRLNRMLIGWANYFCLGRVRQAYSNVNYHAVKRLRQWLCHKHKVRGNQGTSRFSDKYLHDKLGLVRIETLIRNRPWAKA